MDQGSLAGSGEYPSASRRTSLRSAALRRSGGQCSRARPGQPAASFGGLDLYPPPGPACPAPHPAHAASPSLRFSGPPSQASWGNHKEPAAKDVRARAVPRDERQRGHGKSRMPNPFASAGAPREESHRRPIDFHQKMPEEAVC